MLPVFEPRFLRDCRIGRPMRILKTVFRLPAPVVAQKTPFRMRPTRGHFTFPSSRSLANLSGSGDGNGNSSGGLLGGVVVSAFSHGTVHEAGEDLQAAVESDSRVLALWENLAPLGRNEFICWVDDAKQSATRQRRIARTCDELLEGKKRPCCWAGCIHRADKKPSRWQQAVLIDQKGKSRA